MEIESIVFIVVLIASIVFLTKNILRLVSYLKVAKATDRTDNVSARIAQTFKVAFGQSKIFRFSTAGPIHAGIFWGFLVFLFSASEAVIQGVLALFGVSFSWSFLGPIYTAISFSTDIFSVLIIVAIIFSFLRRYVIKVERLQGDEHEKKDAMIVLGAIFLISTSLLIENSIAGHYHKWAFMPIASALSNIIPASLTLYHISWWLHILVILAFANYLPYSKHLHVYTSIPNVYLSTLGPVNKLEKIDFEEEGVEKFGVVDIDDLTWKNLLDSYSCTHCGRCTSVCPANQTGKELSPREIMVQMRERTFEFAPVLLKKQAAKPEDGAEVQLNEADQVIADKKFVGDYQSVEALWQCTTCGACMQECPIMIEHVPAIVGMRRNLVMMEANFPPELQPSFNDLENNSSPWAFSQAERADWAEGLDVKTAAENPDFDILFWVGCAGSFDDRAKKISVAFSKLMNLAGINYAILGTEEQCNGDLARRTGNEYLADMLVKMNIETLTRYNVKKIVTICPHCFNTFKNEYPDFGAEFEVVHHSEFLNGLVKQGKFKMKSKDTHRLNIAYHDSCYLGRYNNMYDEPRELLKAIPGVNVVEPERTKDKGFCCGAGGGQMFMEETAGKRVNVERTEELLNTNAKTIGLNCPFCITMITDGTKTKDREDVQVQDIAEILLDNIEGSDQA